MDLAIFLMDLSGGGAERVMINLANELVTQGLEVELVLVKAQGPYLSQLSPNLKVIEFKKARLISSLPNLIHYLKQEQPPILISALEDTNLVMLWAKKLSGTATQAIVTVHNNLSEEVRNSTQLKRRIVYHLVKFFYSWADKIIAVSLGVAKNLATIGLPQEKISTIYNPIVTSDLQDKSRESVKHPWFSPGQPPVILGVGRLTKQKDFSTLILAFSKVRRQHFSRLVILGEGEESSKLENLVKELGLADSVAFLGFVSNPYAHMARAKVLVMSSVYEGFGNVLVEAMAAGTPVVSTNCESGPAEILDGGKYGKLVAVGAVGEMAEAIIETLSHPLDKTILIDRANDFKLEIIAAQYKKLLKLL